MAGTERLTDVTIRRLKPREHAYLVPDGRGLYLKVQPGGARSWVLRYQLAGRVHDLGLGPYPEVTLAAAREAALKHRRTVKVQKTDPLEARRQAEAARAAEERRRMIFRNVAEDYIKGHEAGWSAKSLAAWQMTLREYAYPEIGDMPVSEIDTPAVLRVVKPLWDSKRETASRLCARLKMIIDAARVGGFIPDGTPNPARWGGHLKLILPAKRAAEHHAALPYAELPSFLIELRKRPGLAARCLEFVILTACRTGEAIGATWPEIDEEARLWCVPGSRMKAGRDHKAPLAGAAMALLATLPRGRAKLFGCSNMAMTMTLRRMGRGDLTVHGFRSTFSDWVAEQTNFPAEVRELALAHAVGSKVEAAYRRGDMFEKRRQLAEAWARFCAGESGRVVPLRRA
jgi:integrase